VSGKKLWFCASMAGEMSATAWETSMNSTTRTMLLVSVEELLRADNILYARWANEVRRARTSSGARHIVKNLDI
jgi:DNA gyrase/topoisomerase IV subunit B